MFTLEEKFHNIRQDQFETLYAMNKFLNDQGEIEIISINTKLEGKNILYYEVFWRY